jgi:hypothetical protein
VANVIAFDGAILRKLSLKKVFDIAEQTPRDAVFVLVVDVDGLLDVACMTTVVFVTGDILQGFVLELLGKSDVYFIGNGATLEIQIQSSGFQL